MFGSGVGFLGTTDLMALSLAEPNPRRWPATILEKPEWPHAAGIQSHVMFGS